MGGATVAQLALDHPELVAAALVLLNPCAAGGPCPVRENWEQQIREEFASGWSAENVAANTPLLR